MEEAVSFLSQGKKLEANLYIPYEGAPTIIMSHGMESSKEGKKWPLFCSCLCEAGFTTLRFSYRDCMNIAEATLTARVKDLKAAMDFLEEKGVNTERLGAIGSSFGGRTLLAARDRRIKAMVLLATPSYLSMPSFIPPEIEQKGGFELESGAKLGLSFFEDLKKYNTLRDLEEINCPILVIHGSADITVPLKEAEEIYRAVKGPKRIEIIRGASHTLDDRPEYSEQLVNLCQEWFKTYLGGL
jgi:dipeptidyl aminopeptidase/acylaminoacyl peptidase